MGAQAVDPHGEAPRWLQPILDQPVASSSGMPPTLRGLRAHRSVAVGRPERHPCARLEGSLALDAPVMDETQIEPAVSRSRGLGRVRRDEQRAQLRDPVTTPSDPASTRPAP